VHDRILLLKFATRVGFKATACMCYRPKIILHELQTQAAL